MIKYLRGDNMKQQDIFRQAKWITFPNEFVSVEAGKLIECTSFVSAKLKLIGFGFFEAYLNGKKISTDRFLPLNTDFHDRKIIIRDKPFPEVTAHRVYVTQYDVTNEMRSGKNSFLVYLYNGWYADERQLSFGDKKLIFEIVVTDKAGNSHYFFSDKDTLCRKSFVTQSILTKGETQDFSCYEEDIYYEKDEWEKAQECSVPETDYLFSDCPPDRVYRSVRPVCIRSEVGKKVYDIGINTSGNAVLLLKGKSGEKVRLIYSEEKNDEYDIDDRLVWGQENIFICDGKAREVSVHSTWNAGRFFAIYGDAELLRFEEIHTDVPIITEFNTDCEPLQWLADAFINTQLSNMHSGIPSDCPHIERRGYTGDGQLACHASMSYLDAGEFYAKWIGDISDCQDRLTGHVQYTAPYTHSGGGPGGWGCAIVHVPFEYYRHYGDISFMKALYPQMLSYFSFLNAHSENGLVNSDVPDEWCLGDWCTAEPIQIPIPFVNNYFYIRSLNEILSLSEQMELTENDIECLRHKKEELISAIIDAYYNDSTGDFAENVQGANAFAVDLGIGDERALKNLIGKYEELGMFDTGIFGTDILTRVLLENGRGDLAFRLLTSSGKYSFDNIRRQGATSLWEYWTGKRSHSHPMFGACAAYLTEFFCGIRIKAGKLHSIEPVYPGVDCFFSCKTEIGEHKVEFSVQYKNGNAEFAIDIPYDIIFIFGRQKLNLKKGTSYFTINI